jgi:hypothetical protein
MARKHDLDEVLRVLAKKGVKFDFNLKIADLKTAKEIGNKSWGKLDFLTNYCGFHIINKQFCNKY